MVQKVSQMAPNHHSGSTANHPPLETVFNRSCFEFRPTLTLCAAYIYGSTVLGPTLMRDRQPFELKKTIQVKQAMISLQGMAEF